MRIKLAAATALVCTTFFFLTSCGGGSGGGRFTGIGKVEGYAFTDGAGAVVLQRLAAGGPGLTPVNNASVTVPGGTPVATNSIGKFRLTGLKAASYKLSVTPSGGAKTDFLVTVVGDATVLVGEPSITRSAAVDQAKLKALTLGPATQVLVVGALSPLPSGTVVKGAMASAGASSDPGMRLASEHWVFMLDRYSDFLYSHPVQYLLIDAATGHETVVDAQSWPLINGVNFFKDQDASLLAGEVAQAPSDVTPAPPTRAAGSGLISPTRHHVEGCATGGKTWVIQLIGGREYQMSKTYVQMSEMLDHAFGSTPNIRTTNDTRGPKDPLQYLNEQMDYIKRNAEPCDTVLIFVYAHGYDGGAFDLEYNGGFFTTGDLQTLTPDSFNFDGLKACHLHIYLDGCWSGDWIPKLAPKLIPKTGLDATIITSTDGEHRALGSGLRHAALPPFQKGGLIFSQFFSEAVGTMSGGMYDPISAFDATIKRLEDESGSAGVRPWWASSALNAGPQLWVRPRQPSETCGPYRAVLLDHNLSVGGEVKYAIGTHVPLARITGGHIQGTDTGCTSEHLHGAIAIDGHTFTDPAGSGCGHGKIVVVQPQ